MRGQTTGGGGGICCVVGAAGWRAAICMFLEDAAAGVVALVGLFCSSAGTYLHCGQLPLSGTAMDSSCCRAEAGRQAGRERTPPSPGCVPSVFAAPACRLETLSFDLCPDDHTHTRSGLYHAHAQLLVLSRGTTGCTAVHGRPDPARGSVCLSSVREACVSAESRVCTGVF